MTDAYAKHYSQLVGKTVKAVAKSPSDEFGEGFYGLIFTDETVAWISRDPEGNGPGFLEIELATPKKKRRV